MTAIIGAYRLLLHVCINFQPMAAYTKRFDEINASDIALVGGKNASLGELYNHMSLSGIRVPDGFATTAEAFRLFIDSNDLHRPLTDLLQRLDKNNYTNLDDIGNACRQLMLGAPLPEALVKEIVMAYRHLNSKHPGAVAVRSSATAEDLPGASFAGQHESYLNIESEQEMIRAVHKCFASLYTDRAIQYREENGFAHDKVALSAGIQKMVRSGAGCSGVCFTLEPESGFRDVVHIAGTWGLGENIVQGTVTPDEFLLFKPALRQHQYAILQKNLGSKEKRMVYDTAGGVHSVDTSPEQQQRFVLNDTEISELGRTALLIEEHYGMPMDIEWAKDGVSGEMYILQARPETVHSRRDQPKTKIYRMSGKYPVITTGMAVGDKIVTGIARVLKSPEEAAILQPGEILVTELTSPDWDPFLKIAGGIITDKGGRTSHASIIAREMGVPAIVGCGNATQKIRSGMQVSLNCAEGKEGKIYEGAVTWQEEILDYNEMKLPGKTSAMLILGDPAQAFRLSSYPCKGVGLLRMEFIINNAIQIHPMALVQYDTLKDTSAKDQIGKLTSGYTDKRQYFIDKLASAVSVIAAAFYPREVIVRMSDFKTNEYAHLLGGKDFEPEEENTMLGFRGASRYYHPLYRDGFRLECDAMKKVRNEMGLTNVKLMIPFCRTVAEGEKVVAIMKEYGLVQKENGLEIYMMAEIPSNVLEADAFAKIFDGFSIGSNDLTQLTLGIDRDSAIIAPLFSERNAAAMKMISMMIRQAKAAGRKIGLCGQAPSDDPEFAAFLVREGIDSISFNPDAFFKGIAHIVKAEESLQENVLHAVS